jgi:hypothetical protein
MKSLVEKISISAATAISAVAIGVGGAEAANLTGPGTVTLNGAVQIKQTVIDDKGTPLNLLDDVSSTSFNFLPNVVGGAGVTIPFGGAVGGFSSFTGTNPINLFANNGSLITDTVVDGSLGPSFLSAVIPNFIELRDETGFGTGTKMKLTRVDLPTYETSGTGAAALTTAKLNVYGEWSDALSGKVYIAEGLFTSTFIAESEAQVLANLRTGTGVVTGFTGTINAKEVEVPEPGIVGSLVGMGIMGLIAKAKKFS